MKPSAEHSIYVLALASADRAMRKIAARLIIPRMAPILLFRPESPLFASDISISFKLTLNYANLNIYWI